MIFRCAIMTQSPARSQIDACNRCNSWIITIAAQIHTTNSSVPKQPHKQESANSKPAPFRRPPLQGQMGGPVHQQRDDNQIAQQIQPSRHYVLLAEKRSANPIHVLFWPPEIIDRHDYPGSKGLILPSALVVPQPPYRPEQQWRRHHVKQTHKSEIQRKAAVEHVFRSTDEMPAAQDCAQQIDGVETLEQEQSGGLPGKNQGAFQPQRQCDKEIPQIAEK